MRHPIDTIVQMSEELGVKLEVTRGLPTWEAFPGMRHQKAIRRIVASIAPLADHSCFEVADVYILFPDGSLKRPDLAIYCVEPADTDGATTELPAAVIEVVSPHYETKDFDLNPPFYLAHGIADVVIFDPRSAIVLHHRLDSVQRHISPVQLDLGCGCRVTV